MDKSLVEKPDYGNWMSKKFIYIPGATSLCFWGLSFALIALVVVAGILLLVAVYFAYARYRFSPAGRDVKPKSKSWCYNIWIGMAKGKGWILEPAVK